MDSGRDLPEDRTAALMANNPFRMASFKDVSNGGSPNEHSGTIADKLKRDDAAMTHEIAVLSKRIGGKQSESTVSFREDAATSSTKRRNKKGPLTIEIKEVHSTGTFIARKREVGLMRFSLASKEAEIRHLEEEMDRSEKRMRQQQEQLVSTQEKFNNFLKHSNLEQDAAVRRAEVESKAKKERLVDIKKLSAQISHVEQDMRKTEAQLDLCLEYKNFMDNLTTPQWFYNVLLDLRVKDASDVILAEAEERYARRSDELIKEDEELPEQRDQVMKERSALDERSYIPHGSVTGFANTETERHSDDPGEKELDLEAKLAQLHEELEKEAQQRQAEVMEKLKQEIDLMPIEEVRAILDNNYPHDRIPMFFDDPDQILDIFINVEEGNLFLIQNSQELEEELERVGMDFFNEEADMKSMVEQRHAQMDSLSTRIRETNERLQQLNERLADLKSADATALPDAQSPDAVGKSGGKKKEGVMSQEALKRCIETTVLEIFQCINLHAMSATRRTGDGAGDDALSTTRSAKSPAGRRQPPGRGASPSLAKRETQRGAAGAPGTGGGGTEGETGSNIGPVEMLTIIENRLDELHRFIVKRENNVDESLIMSVLKSRDKERRREARMVHLAKQSAEREERNRRALERSQAPVVRRRGKPIMWRSRLPVESLDTAEQKKGPSTTDEDDVDEEFF